MSSSVIETSTVVLEHKHVSVRLRNPMGRIVNSSCFLTENVSSVRYMDDRSMLYSPKPSLFIRHAFEVQVECNEMLLPCQLDSWRCSAA